MTPPAFLWDFDGTLVDTAALWRQSEYGFLEERGHAWNEEASRRLIGGNLDVVARVFEEVTGVRFSEDELMRDFVGRVEKALGTDVPWIGGAVPLLREQHGRGLRSALVTSSYESLVLKALALLDFAPFETIVTRDDVRRPKPDPEPYVLALHRLGIEGAQALVIEDSMSGVASALAAGCHVLAVGPHAAEAAGTSPRIRHVDGLEGLTVDAVLAKYPAFASLRA